MSEGFEPYHVPQQSRRDKLRIVVQTTSSNDTDQGCVGLMPLYDHTLLPSDLLTCAAVAAGHPLGAEEPCKSQSSVCVSSVVKEEGGSFMGCVGGVGFLPSSSSSSSSSAWHLYLDPHSSATVNPSCGQEIISHNPFLYATQVPQNLRDFDELVTYRTQPLSLDSTSKGLSLSLSSQYQNHPLELNLQHYSGSIFGEKGLDGYVAGPSTVNELSRSSVPLGPFTGYASVLKGSRFLKPAQQLLDEFCNVGRGIYGDRSCEESSSMVDPCLENFSEPSGMVDDSVHAGDDGDNRRKKTRLISMLDEVYRRYKQYYQQLQAVITSFESVAGLSTSAPYTSLALKSMSKHFRCLKNAITNQIRFTSNALGEESFGKEATPRFGHADPSLHLQRAAHSSVILEPQHGWRPQRGLPERAVAVLRAWLFEHFLHPYPTDTDKQMLAKQTGLSRNQVSNWFINARVRLWKPMVEEIHTLEMRQGQKAPEGEDGSLNKPREQPPTTARLPSNNNSQNAATQKNQDLPSKRCRNEFAHAPNKSDGLMNFLCDDLSNPHLVGLGVSVAGGGNGGVSLTLGLRQDNGICLAEPLPMNVSSRFGLDENNTTYVMGGFEAYNSHFEKNIGGKLLHDFVG